MFAHLRLIQIQFHLKFVGRHHICTSFQRRNGLSIVKEACYCCGNALSTTHKKVLFILIPGQGKNYKGTIQLIP